MFSDYSENKLEINKRKRSEKSLNKWHIEPK